MYGLLGEVRIGREAPLPELPNGFTLVLLGALLVNANREVSKADLIRAVWGRHTGTEAQLYKRIKEVRDLLARVGRQDDLRTRARFGYELHVADEDLDALLFVRLVERAGVARAGDRTDDEVDLLRRALRLWRGPRALANVPGEVFRRDAAVLEQRRKRAAVRLFDLELARGEHERVLDEICALAAVHPIDRRLRQQLMIAWYRCGHSTDAIAAYEDYRGQLAEEAGGEPDPALRALYFAIARGDEAEIAVTESAIADRAGPPVAAVWSGGRGDGPAPGRAAPLLRLPGPYRCAPPDPVLPVGGRVTASGGVARTAR